MEAKEVPSRYHVWDRILLEHWSKQRTSWMNGGFRQTDSTSICPKVRVMGLVVRLCLGARGHPQ